MVLGFGDPRFEISQIEIVSNRPWRDAYPVGTTPPACPHRWNRNPRPQPQTLSILVFLIGISLSYIHLSKLVIRGSSWGRGLRFRWLCPCPRAGRGDARGTGQSRSAGQQNRAWTPAASKPRGPKSNTHTRYTHTHTHTHTHTDTQMHRYTDTHIRTYAHTHIRTCAHAHMRTCAHSHITFTHTHGR